MIVVTVFPLKIWGEKWQFFPSNFKAKIELPTAEKNIRGKIKMLKKLFPLPNLSGRQQELNNQISDQVMSIQIPQQTDWYKRYNIHICSH